MRLLSSYSLPLINICIMAEYTERIKVVLNMEYGSQRTAGSPNALRHYEECATFYFHYTNASLFSSTITNPRVLDLFGLSSAAHYTGRKLWDLTFIYGQEH